MSFYSLKQMRDRLRRLVPDRSFEIRAQPHIDGFDYELRLVGRTGEPDVSTTITEWMFVMDDARLLERLITPLLNWRSPPPDAYLTWPL